MLFYSVENFISYIDDLTKIHPIANLRKSLSKDNIISKINWENISNNILYIKDRTLVKLVYRLFRIEKIESQIISVFIYNLLKVNEKSAARLLARIFWLENDYDDRKSEVDKLVNYLKSLDYIPSLNFIIQYFRSLLILLDYDQRFGALFEGAKQISLDLAKEFNLEEEFKLISEVDIGDL